MTLTYALGIRPGGLVAKSLWALGAFLSVAVALVSWRYLAEVGQPPEVVAGNAHIAPWLVIHVVGATTALIVGPFQFLPRLRARWRAVHRLMGRIYVTACLVGGVAGLVLASGASTGPISIAGFGMLAILWLVSTALAWRYAVQRRLDQHRAWMIRSFALTFAAVTLRLYLPILTFLPVNFNDGYRAISFLSWVPNLLIAEVYLRRRSYAV